MAAMEYPYGLQEIVVDVPFLEERGFGPLALMGVETNHAHLPTAISQWSTTDPTIFQANDQATWSSSRLRMHPHPSSSTAGGVYDMCVQPSIATSSQHVLNVAQTSNCQQQQLLPLDQQQQVPANSSSNNSNSSGDPNFPVAGEIYPWMHQMILNHFMIQERGSTDHMSQLVSDFSAQQQPCLYTSSSECPQDADSSESSGARDYSLPSSGVTACSSEEINWRNSDVVQGNFAASSTGFHFEELYDDSSSVAPIGHAEVLDTNAHSQSSPLSLVMQRSNASALINRTPKVSWAMSGAESDSSVGAMTANHCSTLDPLLNIAGFQDLSGPSSCQPPPYKRPRLSYSSSAAAGRNSSSSMPVATTTSSRPLVSSSSSSLHHHRNMVGGASSDYPMTSLNVADALYRDLHFSGRQPMSCSSLQRQQQQQQTVNCIIQDVPCGGVSISGRYEHVARKDNTTLTEHDTSRTAPNRKHNATSIEPQSVAARHRRKKISERVKVLEKLIPGGNKMDTASMLDEAIEYVKFLQLQVGILEKLGDLPDSSSNNRRSQQTSSSCLMSNGTAAASSSTYHGSSSVSRPTPTIPVRQTSSPLILSEVLQDQLFKQKLCLVSLRQYPSGGSPSGSYA